MAYRKTQGRKSSEIAVLTQKLGNPIFSTFYTTECNYFRGYDYNGRGNRESVFRWDCSELSSALVNQQIKDMSATGVAWKTDFNQLASAFKTGSTTAYQRAALDRMHVPVIRGKNTIMNTELKPGMVIYMQYPKTRGGYSGHVATVTRNPETGELMISESIAGRNNIGVIHRSVHDFFTKGRTVNNPRTRFSLYDPYHKDRDMLDSLDQQAQKISSHYNAGLEAYKQQRGLRRVSGRHRNPEMEKLEFLERFIETRMGNDHVNLRHLKQPDSSMLTHGQKPYNVNMPVFNSNRLNQQLLLHVQADEQLQQSTVEPFRYT